METAWNVVVAVFGWIKDYEGLWVAVAVVVSAVIGRKTLKKQEKNLDAQRKSDVQNVVLQTSLIHQQEKSVKTAMDSLEDQRDARSIDAFAELFPLLQQRFDCIAGKGTLDADNTMLIKRLLLRVSLVAPAISNECERLFALIQSLTGKGFASVLRRSFVLYVVDFDHDGSTKSVVGVDI